MSRARTWHDRTAVDLTAAGWARLVPGFLGAGFRLGVPADRAAVDHAADGARRVADLLGAPFDAAPWAALRAEPAVVEIAGGWERHLVRGLGAPWTRVAPAAPAADRTVTARTLPWPWPESPAAGLPTLSRLADHQAGRWLAAQGTGPGLGLWVDRAGALRSTTAGAPLVRLVDGRWVRPAAGAWAGRPVATLALPVVPVPAALLAAATALVAVSDLGEVTVAESLDGRPLEVGAARDVIRTGRPGDRSV